MVAPTGVDPVTSRFSVALRAQWIRRLDEPTGHPKQSLVLMITTITEELRHL